MMKHILFVVLMTLNALSAFAQYVVNGSATQLSCNCYRLTQAVNNQSGSVWNENMISLTDSFDYTFDVYLGNNDFGADGIAFVLQPISTSIGSTGGGLGYDGIAPSLAVEIDTYQNTNLGDPSYDHIAVMANGITDHSNPAGNLAGPVSALPDDINIEDGQDHLLRVAWDPLTLTLQIWFDGILRLEYQGNIVQDIFGGDPLVFWGFTGSTGGLNNEQRFCLAIIPRVEVTVPWICAGDSVLVIDSSYSALGSVVEWTWDFGNGQTSNAENPGYVTYADAGDYYIVQSIVDAAGCDAIDSTLLTVIPGPVAQFTAEDVCEGVPTVFINTSSAEVGEIVAWEWELGAYAATAEGATPVHTYPQPGTFEVLLTVTTTAGCSGQFSSTVNVNTLPTSYLDQGSDGLLASFITWPNGTESVQWIFADTVVTEAEFQLMFPDSGTYEVMLVTTNAAGCSDTLLYSFYLEGYPEYEIPNVFTPNGDLINDRFEPFTYAINGAGMKVFNRWGREVYTFEGPLQPGVPWGWDGTINGGPQAAEGTYYFTLELQAADGMRYREQGSVTLIR